MRGMYVPQTLECTYVDRQISNRGLKAHKAHLQFPHKVMKTANFRGT